MKGSGHIKNLATPPSPDYAVCRMVILSITDYRSHSGYCHLHVQRRKLLMSQPLGATNETQCRSDNPILLNCN